MTEQAPELQGAAPGPEKEPKPVVFAVRIDPVLREQIEGLRGITGQSVNDVGVEALDDWVAKTLADEAVSQKAMAELDAEEQRLQQRRAAIAGILGNSATGGATAEETTPDTPSAGRGSRRAKSAE